MTETTISNSYLTFKLHNELFAVNVEKVLEVLLEYRLVEVPDAPTYIAGMINFRGDIIPVINFRKKFNFPESSNKNIIIVMDIVIDEASIKFGAIVDGVKDVFDVNKEEIKTIPEFGSKYNPEYLTGMIHKNDEFFMLLDIEKIFSDKEIEIIKKKTKRKTTAKTKAKTK